MASYEVRFWVDCAEGKKTFIAESEGDAIEMFEEWSERYDPEIEFVGIREID